MTGPCECDEDTVPGTLVHPFEYGRAGIDRHVGTDVARCDECRRYAGDFDAAVAWAAATGGGWVVTDWAPDERHESAVMDDGQTVRVYRDFEQALVDLRGRIGQPDGDGLVRVRGQVDYVEPAEGVECVAVGA